MKQLIIFLLLCSAAYAQWQTDVRLTNDAAYSATAYNNTKCIAANGNTIHVVWEDWRAGGVEVFYKRSSDAGLTWGTDTRLTNNPSFSGHAGVANNGIIVHVVWTDNRDGQYEVYYKRSSDDGLTWGADTRLTTNTTNNNKLSSISVSGNFVHIVWDDIRNGNIEVYYKRSNDGGLSWGTDTRLTTSTFIKYYPTVAVSGTTVHVAWEDLRDGNEEIYYKRSSDNGTTWGADTRLTNDNQSSRYPSITSSGINVYVAWSDYRSISTFRLYYKRSNDGGLTWSSDYVLDNTVYGEFYGSIVSFGPNVHVVWGDYRDHPTAGEIYYKNSTDNGLTWTTSLRLTNEPAESIQPSVAVNSTDVFTVWTDYRDGNNEIYFKKNPGGNSIGIQQISSTIPKQYSLSQNYPNPFNPTTNIQFAIPKTSIVKLVVYDVLGKEIAVLVNEELKVGTYNYDWDASSWASGLYFYKLVAGDFVETKKMLMIK